MKISRRNFIISCLSLIPTLAYSENLTSVDFDDYLVKTIKDKFKYLTFNDKVIDKFIQDYKNFSPGAYRIYKGSFKHYKDKIKGSYQEQIFLEQFLMSTNFFWAKNKKNVAYMTYYDPELRPCLNPFAKLF